MATPADEFISYSRGDKDKVLASERKGQILSVHLEPTQIPPSLRYCLAGIQHIDYFQGDPDENLKAILRSLERLGVTLSATQREQATASAADQPLLESASEGAPGADHAIKPWALAVLPFDDISPDQETDYFSAGLTQELIARLSLVSEVGRREDAVREGDTALELSPGDSVMLYNGACLYAQLGEKRRAIATLREAIAAGVENYGWMKNAG